MELLVSIAIASILLSIAVPNFSAVMSNTRQVSLYNKMNGLVRYARSEAIKRSTPVSICPRASDTQCGSDWSQGLLVFEDSANNGKALVYDGADTTLRSYSFPESDITLNVTALLESSGSPAPVNAIRFDGRGQPDWFNGTMVLCDDRGDQSAVALIMTGSGIARNAYSTPESDHVVLDARGEPVSCS